MKTTPTCRPYYRRADKQPITKPFASASCPTRGFNSVFLVFASANTTFVRLDIILVLRDDPRGWKKNEATRPDVLAFLHERSRQNQIVTNPQRTVVSRIENERLLLAK